MFYSDGEAEFRNWYIGEPQDFTHNEYCALSGNGGSWADYPCESTIPSVCSDVRGQNVTFVYINIPMTWTEAQSYCRAHHTDLASVRNMTENQKVVELIPSGQIAWIGLFRHLWWSDGQIYTFHYWRNITQSGAGEMCVLANFADSGKWSGFWCDMEFPFICYSQSAQRHVMKVKLEVMEPNSNLDMDDSAVREGILQQLKQKLDQGGNKNIRLSWSKGSDGKVFHKVKKETRKKRSPEGEL
ncbi:putative C-type lectin domain family 20 member A [Amphiprion ocellaris]|uniref:putative C-type lectin domain family 20 member A n=1 Tax=Amphiprion ocellaris TaxID=80972 RepID=UPI002410E12C|nr:putative C-type lectin domain family 20 member A [Amphiprion ocellaris]